MAKRAKKKAKSRQASAVRLFFVSYSHEATSDVALAGYLARELKSLGHSVFIDTELEVGTKWPNAIEEAIERADVFVVLLFC